MRATDRESDASNNIVGIRRPYQSKVPADDRAGPEGVCDLRAVRRLVQIAERLVVLPVRDVVPHGLDELVAHGRQGHRSRGPDLPVWCARSALVCLTLPSRAQDNGNAPDLVKVWRVSSGTPNASAIC